MAECFFCGAEGARLNAAHWLGDRYERVDVCVDWECRDRIASAPRRPRRKREQPILDAGGWAMVPALNRMMAGKKK